MKPILLSLLVFFNAVLFAQSGLSQFSDPTGKYTSTISGLCGGCNFSNTSQVADMDLSNYGTLTITSGIIVTATLRVKLNTLSPGNTYAGYYMSIGSVVSALPSVSISTYKNGTLRQNLITNGNIVTLLGGSSGYITALTSTTMDYNEVELVIRGGLATVGMTARIYYALGGYSSPPLFALPIHFSSVSVQANRNGKPAIEWTAGSEEGASFIVERNEDGLHFDSIGTVKSGFNSNGHFSFVDNTAADGIKYVYRIAGLNNGQVIYSKSVHFFNTYKPSITLYPNPVNDNFFVISLLKSESQNGLLELVNLNGVVVHSQKVSTQSNSIKVYLPQQIKPGYYIVRLITENRNANELRTERLLIQ